MTMELIPPTLKDSGFVFVGRRLAHADGRIARPER